MVTPSIDPDEDANGAYPGTPRWVIAMGVVAIVVLAVIGLVLSTGLGGAHGPQRHGPGDEAGASDLVRAIAQRPDTVERW